MLKFITSSRHFASTLLAAVASNVKARWSAKKFDIWKECQDNNRNPDGWLSGDWIASDGKLYYGHPLFLFFESYQNAWWLSRNS